MEALRTRFAGVAGALRSGESGSADVDATSDRSAALLRDIGLALRSGGTLSSSIVELCELQSSLLDLIERYGGYSAPERGSRVDAPANSGLAGVSAASASSPLAAQAAALSSSLRARSASFAAGSAIGPGIAGDASSEGTPSDAAGRGGGAPPRGARRLSNFGPSQLGALITAGAASGAMRPPLATAPLAPQPSAPAALRPSALLQQAALPAAAAEALAAPSASVAAAAGLLAGGPGALRPTVRIASPSPSVSVAPSPLGSRLAAPFLSQQQVGGVFGGSGGSGGSSPNRAGIALPPLNALPASEIVGSASPLSPSTSLPVRAGSSASTLSSIDVPARKRSAVPFLPSPSALSLPGGQRRTSTSSSSSSARRERDGHLHTIKALIATLVFGEGADALLERLERSSKTPPDFSSLSPSPVVVAPAAVEGGSPAVTARHNACIALSFFAKRGANSTCDEIVRLGGVRALLALWRHASASADETRIWAPVIEAAALTVTRVLQFARNFCLSSGDQDRSAGASESSRRPDAEFGGGAREGDSDSVSFLSDLVSLQQREEARNSLTCEPAQAAISSIVRENDRVRELDAIFLCFGVSLDTALCGVGDRDVDLALATATAITSVCASIRCKTLELMGNLPAKLRDCAASAQPAWDTLFAERAATSPPFDPLPPLQPVTVFLDAAPLLRAPHEQPKATFIRQCISRLLVSVWDSDINALGSRIAPLLLRIAALQPDGKWRGDSGGGAASTEPVASTAATLISDLVATKQAAFKALASLHCVTKTSLELRSACSSLLARAHLRLTSYRDAVAWWSGTSLPGVPASSGALNLAAATRAGGRSTSREASSSGLPSPGRRASSASAAKKTGSSSGFVPPPAQRIVADTRLGLVDAPNLSLPHHRSPGMSKAETYLLSLEAVEQVWDFLRGALLRLSPVLDSRSGLVEQGLCSIIERHLRCSDIPESQQLSLQILHFLVEKPSVDDGLLISLVLARDVLNGGGATTGGATHDTGTARSLHLATGASSAAVNLLDVRPPPLRMRSNSDTPASHLRLQEAQTRASAQAVLPSTAVPALSASSTAASHAAFLPPAPQLGFPLARSVSAPTENAAKLRTASRTAHSEASASPPTVASYHYVPSALAFQHVLQCGVNSGPFPAYPAVPAAAATFFVATHQHSCDQETAWEATAAAVSVSGIVESLLRGLSISVSAPGVEAAPLEPLRLVSLQPPPPPSFVLRQRAYVAASDAGLAVSGGAAAHSSVANDSTYAIRPTNASIASIFKLASILASCRNAVTRKELVGRGAVALLAAGASAELDSLNLSRKMMAATIRRANRAIAESRRSPRPVPAPASAMASPIAPADSSGLPPLREMASDRDVPATTSKPAAVPPAPTSTPLLLSSAPRQMFVGGRSSPFLSKFLRSRAEAATAADSSAAAAVLESLSESPSPAQAISAGSSESNATQLRQRRASSSAIENSLRFRDAPSSYRAELRPLSLSSAPTARQLLLRPAQFAGVLSRQHSLESDALSPPLDHALSSATFDGTAAEAPMSTPSFGDAANGGSNRLSGSDHVRNAFPSTPASGAVGKHLLLVPGSALEGGDASTISGSWNSTEAVRQIRQRLSSGGGDEFVADHQMGFLSRSSFDATAASFSNQLRRTSTSFSSGSIPSPPVGPSRSALSLRADTQLYATLTCMNDLAANVSADDARIFVAQGGLSVLIAILLSEVQFYNETTPGPGSRRTTLPSVPRELDIATLRLVVQTLSTISQLVSVASGSDSEILTRARVLASGAIQKGAPILFRILGCGYDSSIGLISAGRGLLSSSFFATQPSGVLPAPSARPSPSQQASSADTPPSAPMRSTVHSRQIHDNDVVAGRSRLLEEGRMCLTLILSAVTSHEVYSFATRHAAAEDASSSSPSVETGRASAAPTVPPRGKRDERQHCRYPLRASVSTLFSFGTISSLVALVGSDNVETSRCALETIAHIMHWQLPACLEQHCFKKSSTAERVSAASARALDSSILPRLAYPCLCCAQGCGPLHVVISVVQARLCKSHYGLTTHAPLCLSSWAYASEPLNSSAIGEAGPVFPGPPPQAAPSGLPADESTVEEAALPPIVREFRDAAKSDRVSSLLGLNEPAPAPVQQFHPLSALLSPGLSALLPASRYGALCIFLTLLPSNVLGLEQAVSCIADMCETGRHDTLTATASFGLPILLTLLSSLPRSSRSASSNLSSSSPPSSPITSPPAEGAASALHPPSVSTSAASAVSPSDQVFAPSGRAPVALSRPHVRADSLDNAVAEPSQSPLPSSSSRSASYISAAPSSRLPPPLLAPLDRAFLALGFEGGAGFLLDSCGGRVDVALAAWRSRWTAVERRRHIAERCIASCRIWEDSHSNKRWRAVRRVLAAADVSVAAIAGVLVWAGVSLPPLKSMLEAALATDGGTLSDFVKFEHALQTQAPDVAATTPMGPPSSGPHVASPEELAASLSLEVAKGLQLQKLRNSALQHLIIRCLRHEIDVTASFDASSVASSLMARTSLPAAPVSQTQANDVGSSLPFPHAFSTTANGRAAAPAPPVLGSVGQPPGPIAAPMFRNRSPILSFPLLLVHAYASAHQQLLQRRSRALLPFSVIPQPMLLHVATGGRGGFGGVSSPLYGGDEGGSGDDFVRNSRGGSTGGVSRAAPFPTAVERQASHFSSSHPAAPEAGQTDFPGSVSMPDSFSALSLSFGNGSARRGVNWRPSGLSSAAGGGAFFGGDDNDGATTVDDADDRSSAYSGRSGGGGELPSSSHSFILTSSSPTAPGGCTALQRGSLSALLSPAQGTGSGRISLTGGGGGASALSPLRSLTPREASAPFSPATGPRTQRSETGGSSITQPQGTMPSVLSPPRSSVVASSSVRRPGRSTATLLPPTAACEMLPHIFTTASIVASSTSLYSDKAPGASGAQEMPPQSLKNPTASGGDETRRDAALLTSRGPNSSTLSAVAGGGVGTWLVRSLFRSTSESSNSGDPAGAHLLVGGAGAGKGRGDTRPGEQGTPAPLLRSRSASAVPHLNADDDMPIRIVGGPLPPAPSDGPAVAEGLSRSSSGGGTLSGVSLAFDAAVAAVRDFEASFLARATESLGRPPDSIGSEKRRPTCAIAPFALIPDYTWMYTLLCCVMERSVQAKFRSLQQSGAPPQNGTSSDVQMLFEAAEAEADREFRHAAFDCSAPRDPRGPPPLSTRLQRMATRDGRGTRFSSSSDGDSDSSSSSSFSSRSTSSSASAGSSRASSLSPSEERVVPEEMPARTAAESLSCDGRGTGGVEDGAPPLPQARFSNSSLRLPARDAAHAAAAAATHRQKAASGDDTGLGSGSGGRIDGSFTLGLLDAWRYTPSLYAATSLPASVASEATMPVGVATEPTYTFALTPQLSASGIGERLRLASRVQRFASASLPASADVDHNSNLSARRPTFPPRPDSNQPQSSEDVWFRCTASLLALGDPLRSSQAQRRGSGYATRLAPDFGSGLASEQHQYDLARPIDGDREFIGEEAGQFRRRSVGRGIHDGDNIEILGRVGINSDSGNDFDQRYRSEPSRWESAANGILVIGGDLDENDEMTDAHVQAQYGGGGLTFGRRQSIVGRSISGLGLSSLPSLHSTEDAFDAVLDSDVINEGALTFDQVYSGELHGVPCRSLEGFVPPATFDELDGISAHSFRSFSAVESSSRDPESEPLQLWSNLRSVIHSPDPLSPLDWYIESLRLSFPRTDSSYISDELISFLGHLPDGIPFETKASEKVKNDLSISDDITSDSRVKARKSGGLSKALRILGVSHSTPEEIAKLRYASARRRFSSISGIHPLVVSRLFGMSSGRSFLPNSCFDREQIAFAAKRSLGCHHLTDPLKRTRIHSVLPVSLFTSTSISLLLSSGKEISSDSCSFGYPSNALDLNCSVPFQDKHLPTEYSNTGPVSDAINAQLGKYDKVIYDLGRLAFFGSRILSNAVFPADPKGLRYLSGLTLLSSPFASVPDAADAGFFWLRSRDLQQEASVDDSTREAKETAWKNSLLEANSPLSGEDVGDFVAARVLAGLVASVPSTTNSLVLSGPQPRLSMIAVSVGLQQHWREIRVQAGPLGCVSPSQSQLSLPEASKSRGHRESTASDATAGDPLEPSRPGRSNSTSSDAAGVSSLSRSNAPPRSSPLLSPRSPSPLGSSVPSSVPGLSLMHSRGSFVSGGPGTSAARKGSIDDRFNVDVPQPSSVEALGHLGISSLSLSNVGASLDRLALQPILQLLRDPCGDVGPLCVPPPPPRIVLPQHSDELVDVKNGPGAAAEASFSDDEGSDEDVDESKLPGALAASAAIVSRADGGDQAVQPASSTQRVLQLVPIPIATQSLVVGVELGANCGSPYVAPAFAVRDSSATFRAAAVAPPSHLPARLYPYVGLRHLDLSGNALGDDGAADVLSTLADPQCPTPLTSLNLSDNLIYVGANVCEALTNRRTGLFYLNSSLKSLNLSSNPLSEAVVKAILLVLAQARGASGADPTVSFSSPPRAHGPAAAAFADETLRGGLQAQRVPPLAPLPTVPSTLPPPVAEAAIEALLSAPSASTETLLVLPADLSETAPASKAPIPPAPPRSITIPPPPPGKPGSSASRLPSVRVPHQTPLPPDADGVVGTIGSSTPPATSITIATASAPSAPAARLSALSVVGAVSSSGVLGAPAVPSLSVPVVAAGSGGILSAVARFFWGSKPVPPAGAGSGDGGNGESPADIAPFSSTPATIVGSSSSFIGVANPPLPRSGANASSQRQTVSAAALPSAAPTPPTSQLPPPPPPSARGVASLERRASAEVGSERSYHSGGDGSSAHRHAQPGPHGRPSLSSVHSVPVPALYGGGGGGSYRGASPHQPRTVATRLAHLGLAGCGLHSPQLTDALVQCMEHNKTLRDVDLRNNMLSSEAGSRLVVAADYHMRQLWFLRLAGNVLLRAKDRLLIDDNLRTKRQRAFLRLRDAFAFVQPPPPQSSRQQPQPILAPRSTFPISQTFPWNELALRLGVSIHGFPLLSHPVAASGAPAQVGGATAETAAPPAGSGTSSTVAEAATAVAQSASERVDASGADPPESSLVTAATPAAPNVAQEVPPSVAAAAAASVLPLAPVAAALSPRLLPALSRPQRSAAELAAQRALLAGLQVSWDRPQVCLLVASPLCLFVDSRITPLTPLNVAGERSLVWEGLNSYHASLSRARLARGGGAESSSAAGADSPAVLGEGGGLALRPQRTSSFSAGAISPSIPAQGAARSATTISCRFLTNESLLSSLARGADVMHIACHGALDWLAVETPFGKANALGEVDLRNVLGAGGGIRRTEDGTPRVKLVVLAACRSLWAARIMHEAGIPFVVCVDTDEDVQDTACADFLRMFYHALAHGIFIDEAFARAVEAVQVSSDARAHIDGAKFILLMDGLAIGADGSSQRLFSIPPGWYPAPPAPPQPPAAKGDAVAPAEAPLAAAARESGALVLPPPDSAVSKAEESLENAYRGPIDDGGPTFEALLAGLPPLPEHFMGRNAQCQRIIEATHKHRMFTLTGRAGAGKSAVAVAVAHWLAVRSSFPDGVLYVDCRTAADAGLGVGGSADAAAGSIDSNPVGVQPLHSRRSGAAGRGALSRAPTGFDAIVLALLRAVFPTRWRTILSRMESERATPQLGGAMLQQHHPGGTAVELSSPPPPPSSSSSPAAAAPSAHSSDIAEDVLQLVVNRLQGARVLIILDNAEGLDETAADFAGLDSASNTIVANPFTTPAAAPLLSSAPAHPSAEDASLLWPTLSIDPWGLGTGDVGGGPLPTLPPGSALATAADDSLRSSGAAANLPSRTGATRERIRELVSAILNGTRHAHVLATRRRAFEGVRGALEFQMALGELSVDDAARLFGALLGSSFMAEQKWTFERARGIVRAMGAFPGRICSQVAQIIKDGAS